MEFESFENWVKKQPEDVSAERMHSMARNEGDPHFLKQLKGIYERYKGNDTAVSESLKIINSRLEKYIKVKNEMDKLNKDSENYHSEARKIFKRLNW